VTEYVDRTAWLTPKDESYVYRYLDAEGRVIFVGKASEIRPRIYAHRSRPWYAEVVNLEVAPFKTEAEAWQELDAQIHQHHPRHNKVCHICAYYTKGDRGTA
jgi:excinuclease UvrABC nuclease subunit